MKFERIGECLYRRGTTIYARVRINKRLTWRSTETNDPADARKWIKKWKQEVWMLANGIEPKGVILHRLRVTVGELIDGYIEAGCPTRKMQAKAATTIKNEKFFLSPVRAYFGDTAAATVTVGDCDRYRDWRLSGGYVSTFKVRGGHPRTLKTSGGNRSVDLELTVLANVFNLAVRRAVLQSNPFVGRGRYSLASEVRHCREVAPTPEGLKKIENWLRARNEHAVADLVCFLAFSGLRIGEALPLEWNAVNWGEEILQVKREKRGITPWVPILSEMKALLRAMETRRTSHLLFASPFDPNTPRDVSAVRHRITAACSRLKIGHVTPHGLRSYFVTQARQSGLTDAEIAMLIGDKTGPAIIAHTYGDVRPDHLIAQARRIRLTAVESSSEGDTASSNSSSNALPDVTTSFEALPSGEKRERNGVNKGD
jgi:integrase